MKFIIYVFSCCIVAYQCKDARFTDKDKGNALTRTKPTRSVFFTKMKYEDVFRLVSPKKVPKTKNTELLKLDVVKGEKKNKLSFYNLRLENSTSKENGYIRFLNPGRSLFYGEKFPSDSKKTRDSFRVDIPKRFSLQPKVSHFRYPRSDINEEKSHSLQTAKYSLIFDEICGDHIAQFYRFSMVFKANCQHFLKRLNGKMSSLHFSLQRTLNFDYCSFKIQNVSCDYDVILHLTMSKNRTTLITLEYALYYRNITLKLHGISYKLLSYSSPKSRLFAYKENDHWKVIDYLIIYIIIAMVLILLMVLSTILSCSDFIVRRKKRQFQFGQFLKAFGDTNTIECNSFHILPTDQIAKPTSEVSTVQQPDIVIESSAMGDSDADDDSFNDFSSEELNEYDTLLGLGNSQISKLADGNTTSHGDNDQKITSGPYPLSSVSLENITVRQNETRVEFNPDEENCFKFETDL